MEIVNKEVDRMIEITLENDVVQHVEHGTSIYDIIAKREDRDHIYAGILNGKLKDLQYLIKHNGVLTFVYDNSEIGRLIYERTLLFLFIVAVYELDPQAHVSVEHSLSNGQYCDVIKNDSLTPANVLEIEHILHNMIQEKEVIHRDVYDTDAAIALFQANAMTTKATLLQQRKSKTCSVYTLRGTHGYSYGIMLPNTSYITHFAIRYVAPGVWISPQPSFQNQNKLFQVFQEYEQWGKLIGVTNVVQLNENIRNHQMDNMVLMSETMFEKKLGELTNGMMYHHPNIKFVLIAGPSSAGKTSFSKRLSIHLRILGKKPRAISMDNFYRCREDCPKLADGSYDFESLEALNLELFNETMIKLLHKIPVKLPIFNFKTGLREWQIEDSVLDEDEILIIEGIHGLNPRTSQYLPKEAVYKIYINALTHLNLDEHNRIPTSDYRLIRRIARDYQFRSWNAQQTIHFWKNVRNGEDKYIYPYQEEADVIFNTSMIYELSILKKIVIPLLNNVQINEPEYLEANRLIKFLDYFEEGDQGAVPRNSILAEFIGNSVFDVN